MAEARVHLIIHGRVQGVAFRYATKDAADRLGIKGWVRNRREGTVEAVAEGPREQLEKFAAWCRHGPPLARVNEVEVAWQSATGEFDRFAIARTV